MPLPCNIDSRGRLLRLIYGIALLIFGIAMIAFWAREFHGVWRWIVSILVVLGGAFAIFESRKGWCVLRAMGMKTPI